MSPEPDKVGPGEDLEDKVGVWSQSVGVWLKARVDNIRKKTGREYQLAGLIFDNGCIHPMVRLKNGLEFAMGGKGFQNLYPRLANAQGNYEEGKVRIGWGGETRERTYPVVFKDLTVNKDGIFTMRNRVERFPTTTEGVIRLDELYWSGDNFAEKIRSVFEKEDFYPVLIRGLEKAAGLI